MPGNHHRDSSRSSRTTASGSATTGADEGAQPVGVVRVAFLAPVRWYQQGESDAGLGRRLRPALRQVPQLALGTGIESEGVNEMARYTNGANPFGATLSILRNTGKLAAFCQCAPNHRCGLQQPAACLQWDSGGRLTRLPWAFSVVPTRS